MRGVSRDERLGDPGVPSPLERFNRLRTVPSCPPVPSHATLRKGVRHSGWPAERRSPRLSFLPPGDSMEPNQGLRLVPEPLSVVPTSSAPSAVCIRPTSPSSAAFLVSIPHHLHCTASSRTTPPFSSSYSHLPMLHRRLLAPGGPRENEQRNESIPAEQSRSRRARFEPI